DLSGVYVAALDGIPDAGHSFAVNVDTAEGNLAKLAEPELRQGLFAGVQLQFHTDWQALADRPASVSVQSSGLATAILYLLLALLLAETYMARRFGHHR
ncbi:MAG: hypothetical protein ACYC6Y_23265, partial [Thermoguttaceae bacterium]